MNIASMVIEGENIRKIPDLIIEELDGKHYIFLSKDITVLMKEEWYYRIKSNLMTTYIFKFLSDSQAEIQIVTGGGKDDIFVDWGSENIENRKNYRSIKQICDQKGWVISRISPDELGKYFMEDRIAEGVSKFMDKFTEVFFGKEDKE